MKKRNIAGVIGIEVLIGMAIASFLTVCATENKNLKDRIKSYEKILAEKPVQENSQLTIKNLKINIKPEITVTKDNGEVK